MKHFDVIVIGGGAAGILAAGRAAELGAKVLVVEKMSVPGRKLLITGKGRCNITNEAPIEEFIRQIYPNGRFLRTAFSSFFSSDILNILTDENVETTLERGGRYFPTSNRSADVLNALLRWAESPNLELRCNHRAEKLLIKDNVITGLIVNGVKYSAPSVIIATGGASYPATGSTGDGYRLAAMAGHSVITPLPALVPLETSGNIAQKLQGLSLKNVNVSVWIEGKKSDQEFGEMLFTHFGVSGPAILTLSRRIVIALQNRERVEISIDLKPALDEQKLNNRLLRDLNSHGKMHLASIFRQWLPSTMISSFLEILNLNPEKLCHQVTSTERKKIRYLMKNFNIEISGYRPFKEAIVTSGGVDTNEIRSKTMESKLVKGLYFAGEVINLDGRTGGYNLQIAWSTGWLAGNSSVTG